MEEEHTFIGMLFYIEERDLQREESLKKNCLKKIIFFSKST